MKWVLTGGEVRDLRLKWIGRDGMSPSEVYEQARADDPMWRVEKKWHFRAARDYEKSRYVEGPKVDK